MYRVDLTEVAIDLGQIYLPDYRFLVKDEIVNILKSLL